MSKTTKKSRRNQKKTLGRTKVSRHARYVRRQFFARQMEVEFLKSSKSATPAEIARAEARLATIEAQFTKLPKLARRLEVSPAAAARELAEDGEDEGEE